MSSELISFLPIPFVFAIMYFLVIRPQQKKQKDLQDSRKALRRGDRVVTGGGIIGTVQRTRDDSTEIEVEIAQGVRVQVQRDTIASILSSSVKATKE